MKDKKMTYTYINTSESIGSSILTVIKGVAQLGAGILDKSLDPNFGVTDIAAVGIMLAFLVWMIREAKAGKHAVQSAF